MKKILLPLLAIVCAAVIGLRLWPSSGTTVTLEDIPAFSGEPYVVLNGGQPDFSDEERTTEPFETYSSLDALGRCGVAYANICQELMPTEERGSIGSVKPSGWHLVKYDCVDGKYLYNRCHLIGYQLAGENANECNLITGTRYLNVTGMLPFENQVADYVHETGNHVLYRVTPIFQGSELVARGVQMEALSVEDDGEGVCFNVYVYNCQPGVTIDYATGESWLTEETEADEAADVQEPDRSAPTDNTDDAGETENETNQTDTAAGNAGNAAVSADNGEITYILNNRSMKFHLPSCGGAADIKEQNRSESGEDRETLIAKGYSPCGQCKP